MLTLYHCNTSYASSIARLYLAEKKLPWQSHHIDLRTQEHLSSDYRKINPRATVPTLDDDGELFPNSTDLMVHLERKFKTPALWPHDTAKQDEMIAICREMEQLHDPHLRTLSYANVFMATKKQDADKTARVIELAKTHPDAKRGDFLQRAIQGQLSSEEIDAAKDAIKKAITLMQQRFAAHPGEFIFGEHYSIVDVVYTAVVFRLEQVGSFDVLECYPDLLTWYQNIKQRASFKIAILDLL